MAFLRRRAPERCVVFAAWDALEPAEGETAEKALRIHSAQVEHPVSARYAWTDWSDRANLAGENGLPLEPFAL